MFNFHGKFVRQNGKKLLAEGRPSNQVIKNNRLANTVIFYIIYVNCQNQISYSISYQNNCRHFTVTRKAAGKSDFTYEQATYNL
ncbi:hypothetical protein D7V94_14725 [Parablautia intestinalis]|uniref:Uncharacterized protein n=1 Tax=Parablautia intestinalis TaxID=2320100 RepID=A0A3A9AUT8_9FIRM|nr:hypothetical protein D7V94_14725 [Parablautia intestinalis]